MRRLRGSECYNPLLQRRIHIQRLQLSGIVILISRDADNAGVEVGRIAEIHPIVDPNDRGNPRVEISF